MTPSDHKCLTLKVPEAAALAGVSPGAIYEEIKRGSFPHIRIGRRLVVPRHAFEKFLSGGEA